MYDYLPNTEKQNLTEFEEIIGKGIIAKIQNHKIEIGSDALMGVILKNNLKQTKVNIKIDDHYKGYYLFNHQYREGLEQLFKRIN